MKKILPALALLSLLIIPAGTALAACDVNNCEQCNTKTACEGAGCAWDGTKCFGAPVSDVLNTIRSITNWLFGILMLIAALFIIIAAYYFVTASGDPEKVKTARNYVLYCLIGVLIGFLAKGMVSLVEKIVTGK